MSLPFGWTQQFAIEHALKEIEQLKATVAKQQRDIAQLEATKADRKGRKPSTVERQQAPIAQG